jgi:parvulin-like peptidyl-prolyl isomerase
MDQDMSSSENSFTESSSVKKVNNNLKLFSIGFGIFIAVGILCVLGFGVYRVYSHAATDSFSLGVAKVLRLPVAQVNGKRILYTDYIDDLKAFKTMLAYDKSTGGQQPQISADEISDQILLRLTSNQLLNDLAVTYGVGAEKSDVAELEKQILDQFELTPSTSTVPVASTTSKNTDAARQKADAELKLRYGWDLKTYEKKVMIPYILQNKLSTKIQADSSSHKAVYDVALDVLNKIKTGSKFEDMAKQYGQDGTATQGGDLGWFKKGDMVPNFETAVFALKKGELNQNLVETEYGYHIVRLDDRKVEKVKDATGKLVDQEQVKARHILFRFQDLETILDDKLKHADFKVYVKGIRNPIETLKALSNTTSTPQ